ncbi:GtrA family protein [Cellulosimicrobium cellulans]|uniref:GtrA family protein n=1 Tax=Cellulosimicrobium cellulans TaxID=1710 RepID=UPI00301B4122
MTGTRRRVGTFALVGVANTLIDLVLFGVLRSAGAGILLANALSTTAGLTFSFVANRRFTFGDRAGRSWRQLLLFVGGTGVGLWVLQPLVIVGAGALLEGWGAASPTALLWLPKIAAIGVGMVWNYLFYDKVAFRASPSGRSHGDLGS